MKIAIDVSPLQTGHKVRGVGFYLHHLKDALLQYYPQNIYYEFTNSHDIPKKVDVIHYPYFDPFFISLPLLKMQKIVVTIHDLTPLVFPNHFPAGKKGIIKWNIQKLLLRQVDAIITDSECSKKDIMQFTGIASSKIHPIYLAAGDEFKKLPSSAIETTKKKYNLPQKFLLYVGDATWNKNLPRLLSAVQNTEYTLIMVGKALVSTDIDADNPWNYDLITVQAMIRNNAKIISLGFVPTEDLVALYTCATVLLMPSLYEGFGLPILEAMSCGCPVITTKEGSLPEIAGDAALYTDAYDEKDITNTIEKLMKNKTLQKELMEKGLQQAKKFSWGKVAKETMSVYEHVYEG